LGILNRVEDGCAWLAPAGIFRVSGIPALEEAPEALPCSVLELGIAVFGFSEFFEVEIEFKGN